MRADRLLSVLLLLQQRGQVTAAEVARELEVSERTARRDLEALGTAGVPVYSRQGRNGGWQLVGGARTDLTGLTAAEARALFLVAGPRSSATPEVRTALRKLMQALPEPLRDQAEAAATAVIIDQQAWGRGSGVRPPPPHLEALQTAVIEGAQVRLEYVAADGNETTRVVHPLGLAAKGSVWYLVADTESGLRTFRVERVRSVEPTGEPAVRPDGFDLAEAWRMVTDRFDELRWSITVHATAAVEVVPLLRAMFGSLVRIGPAGEGGRVDVEIGGRDEGRMAAELAGLGGLVEVTAPPAVRDRLGEIGRELVERYG